MAIYKTTGKIVDMSEVTSGTSQNGFEWQRMTLVIEIQGFQGAVTKQAFQVINTDVNDVLLYNIGEQVEVSWVMYARYWNGRWYNSVDLLGIKRQGETNPQPAPSRRVAPAAETQSLIDPQENLNPEDNPDDLPF